MQTFPPALVADLRELVVGESRVSRAAYLRTGFGLMLVKYGIDVALYSMVIGGLWSPLDYLNPMYAQRMAAAPEAFDLPGTYLVFLLLWGLLFAWIGTTWSARRARDAGLSSWWGLFFFVPFFNYALIATLAVLPTRALVEESQARAPRSFNFVVPAGILFLASCGALYAIVVQASQNYGLVAFMALPIFYGVGLGYMLNRESVRGVWRTILMALSSSLVACLALLLFALEGVICIAMAFPVVFVAISIGAMLGRMLVVSGRPRRTAPLCLIFALPLSTWIDNTLAPTGAREVVSSIEIDAPPEVVWQHVVAFSELPKPTEWLFATGIAYPLRARIEGQGVGAVRHCEFSTGAFVEPITVWDEPRRLSFDVTHQPIPMEELSFYDDVRPPHLMSTFRSVRGEFRLTRLPGERTRLEGSTWYELDMAPEVYWRIWSDEIIHRIHGRVLSHVALLSEAHSKD